MADNRIGYGTVLLSIYVTLLTAVCVCDAAWYSEPHRVHGDPINLNKVTRKAIKEQIRQFSGGFGSMYGDDDDDTTGWDEEDSDLEGFDDDLDADLGGGNGLLKKLEKEEKEPVKVQEAPKLAPPTKVSPESSVLKKLAPAPKTDSPTPQTCPCIMKKASPHSKCYYFLAAGSNRCSYRKCRESFECTFGKHVKLTCMRRNTVKQVVPVANVPGECRTKTINGYMYVPYSSAY